MEPFVNSREIQGEIGRILQEQKQLAAQVEAMEQKDRDLTGKRPEELTKHQRAELENLRDTQQRLQGAHPACSNKMKRVAEQRAEKDPENARELQDAASQAEKGNVTGRMRDAARDIQQNQLEARPRRTRRAASRSCRNSSRTSKSAARRGWTGW